MSEEYIETKRIPLLALRGLSVFPGMMLTFDVERHASIGALNAALKSDQMIFLAAQKDLAADMPKEDDIYSVGTVCRIRQQLRQPKGNICRVMVEGVYRAQAVSILTDEEGYSAFIRPLPDKKERVSDVRREALVRNCLNLFDEYIQYNPNMVSEQLLNLLANPDPGYIGGYIAQNVPLALEDKQALLEELYPCRRLEMLGRMVNKELDILAIEKELNDQTQEAMNKSQREYYLREEMKIIQSELGDDDDIEEYRAKVAKLPVSDEVREKLNKEINRLSKQPFGSSEAAVIRGYLDTCLEIPWGKYTQETVNIAKARKILDDEHYGLEKVKERILEYLAVKQISGEVKGGLLCLVGPPGTGKTSIAQSVARAVNRKLVRVSLGGVHDEAEIRGHRRTYIGSMPGRIIQGISKAKSMNPVFLLDEIDKMGRDWRGDPESALLEILDPEQNKSFRDHYLEVDFDLSKVLFIATANSLNLSNALKDRMEIIEIPGYSEDEKVQIAREHLLRRAARDTGWDTSNIQIDDDAIRHIINTYTTEQGVRQLQRELTAILRRQLLENDGEDTPTVFTIEKIDNLLSVRKNAGFSKRIGFGIRA